jgi:fructose-bisphosphate aldolase, class I
VRCAYEAGADVVKVPYCGDVAAYREIVAQCPVPVVAAGGPRAESLPAALAMLADVVRAGVVSAGCGAALGVWAYLHGPWWIQIA